MINPLTCIKRIFTKEKRETIEPKMLYNRTKEVYELKEPGHIIRPHPWTYAASAALTGVTWAQVPTAEARSYVPPSPNIIRSRIRPVEDEEERVGMDIMTPIVLDVISHALDHQDVPDSPDIESGGGEFGGGGATGDWE